MIIDTKLRSILTTLTIFLVILLLLTSPTYSQEKLEDLNLEKVETPTEIKDFIELFESFEFKLTEKRDGEIFRENYIKIKHEGKKKIRGTETDKVVLNGEGTEEIPVMEFWFEKDENKLVKLIVDNQEIPPESAENMIDSILQAVFHPFVFYKQYNLSEYKEFESAEISKSTKKYSEKEYNVTTIKMNNLKRYELESGVMSIADFNDFLLVVSYDLVTLDDQNMKYTVESLKLK
ncbi:MAG: hypothetical protein ACQEQF_08855 [Bacillota bacterium]